MTISDVPTEERGGDQAVRYVLFVCNHNAGRSQMPKRSLSATAPMTCADAVLATFDGARVRSQIMTLAHRQTRECLRRGTCDLIATSQSS